MPNNTLLTDGERFILQCAAERVSRDVFVQDEAYIEALISGALNRLVLEVPRYFDMPDQQADFCGRGVSLGEDGRVYHCYQLIGRVYVDAMIMSPKAWCRFHPVGEPLPEGWSWVTLPTAADRQQAL